MSEILRLPSPPVLYDARDQAELRRLVEMTVLRLGQSVEDLKVRPRVTDVLVTFNDGGRAFITIKCNEDATGFRYAVGVDTAPTEEVVRATDFQVGTEGDFTAEGPFQAGDTVYVAVLPYAGRTADGSDGTEGPLYVQAVTRGARATNECRAIVLASTADTVTVEVNAASDVGMPAITLTSITGAATIETGLAVGVAGESPQRWTFRRPAAGLGNTTVRFTGVFPDAEDDADQLVIPDQTVTSPIFLASRARIIRLTDTEVVVRVAVADPIPQGANTVDVTYVSGGLTITPASGQQLTPAAYFSGADGSYIDFTVQRPIGVTNGSVTFAVSSNAAARVPDSDLVTIPWRSAIPASLDLSYSFDDYEYTISWDGEAVVELSIDGGAFAPPPASPFVVERQAVMGGRSITYTFRATGDYGDTRTETILVLRQAATPSGLPEITTGGIVSVSTPCDGGGEATVSWSVVNMPGTETYDIEWSNLGPGAYNGSSGTVSGVTSPHSLMAPLCSGDTLRCRIKAYVGAALVAEYTVESAV